MLRVDISYRLGLQSLTAVRSRLAPADSPFIRQGEISFEVLDSTGSSVGREIQSLEVYAPSSETPEPGTSWYEGMASVRVPAGRYRLSTELTDLQTNRSFRDRERMIEARTKPSLNASSLVIVRNTATAANVIDVENMEGNFLFGEPASALLFIHGLLDTGSVSASYTVQETERDNEPAENGFHQSGTVHPSFRTNVAIAGTSDSTGIQYRIVGPGTWSVLQLPIPFATLPLRDFRLSILLHVAGDSLHLELPTRALWPTMPASLRDVDRAIEALRFLVPQDTLDRLRDGDFQTKRDGLETFWKRRTPGASPAYRDLMAEYYRRVDYALKSFGTLRQPDALRTDRTRIYVLYGPPTSTHRVLNPAGSYREIWTYTALNKTFIFEDKLRNGTYELVSSTAQ